MKEIALGARLFCQIRAYNPCRPQDATVVIAKVVSLTRSIFHPPYTVQARITNGHAFGDYMPTNILPLSPGKNNTLVGNGYTFYCSAQEAMDAFAGANISKKREIQLQINKVEEQIGAWDDWLDARIKECENGHSYWETLEEEYNDRYEKRTTVLFEKLEALKSQLGC